MHAEAMEFLRHALGDRVDQPFNVLEIGSRDVNGTPRSLFTHPATYYWGVDIEDGAGVDQVGNAAVVDVQDKHLFFGIAICAEVFEHTSQWPEILWNMARHLLSGGLCVVTAATDPREAHSAVDGWDLREGEYYENVRPDALKVVMQDLFVDVVVTTHPRGDVYAYGTKA